MEASDALEFGLEAGCGDGEDVSASFVRLSNKSLWNILLDFWASWFLFFFHSW